MDKPRRIAVIHGSDSDLPQMIDGLNILKQSSSLKDSEIVAGGVYSYSVHRNPNELLKLLHDLLGWKTDVIIVGAGWANHLTAMCDKLLRNMFYDYHTVVIGVAFEDKENDLHTTAAKLSITEVPGHDVVFNGYVGASGFRKACEFAIEGELPEIARSTPKPPTNRGLLEALNCALAKVKKTETGDK